MRNNNRRGRGRRNHNQKGQRGNRNGDHPITSALQKFQEGIPIIPNRKIDLVGPQSPLTIRVLDVFCPIGFGQRAIILAPPKTGKTTFLKDLCVAIAYGAPDAILYSLLIDERPEEVPDFKRDDSSAPPQDAECQKRLPNSSANTKMFRSILKAC